MADEIPAISGVDDPTKVRIGLVQGGKLVSAPMDGVGFQPEDADLTSWALITRGAGFDAFAAAIIGTSGYLVDSVIGTYATNADLTTVLPFDDTIPQNTEGTQIISVSITPKTTTNKLRCRFRGHASGNGLIAISAALFLNSDANALNAAGTSIEASGRSSTLALEHEFVPASISAQTLKIRVGPSSGTMRMNGTVTSRVFGGVNISTLVVEEIKA